MEVISAIGIFAAAFYVFLLLRKENKSFSDKILISWLILFTVHLFLPFMMALGNHFFIEKVNGLDIGFYTLHLTFMYYYALSITNHINRFKLSHLEYLIPTAIIYLVQGTIDRNVTVFSEIIRTHFFNDSKIFHLTGVVILNLIFCIFFTRKSFGILYQHRKAIKNSFSFSENIDLIWLRNLLIATVVFTLILVIYLIALLAGHLNEEWINNYYFTSFSIFAVFLGYRGYRQIEIVFQPKKTATKKVKKKRTKKVVTASEEYTQIQTLKEFMSSEKPYLDPELNIGNLANLLQIHSHRLSKLINSHFSQNFFEFVNTYRVEEFKKLVANPKNKHISILGLALDSGFNSKASFNRIFKNSTGLTPSEYRNQYKF